MKLIVKKIVKMAVKGAALAGLSKLGLMVLRKVNKDGSLEQKAHHVIDVQGEKAKELAKAGVSKTISMSENAETKVDEITEQN